MSIKRNYCILVLSLLLFVTSVTAAELRSYPSPNRLFEAVVEVPNIIKIFDYKKKLVCSKQLSGLEIFNAKWTPDSNYFVFSNLYVGGHMPWHSPTYFYSVKDNKILSLDALIGQVTSADFKLSFPDLIKTEIQDPKNHKNNIRINEMLSRIEKRLRK